MRDRRKKETEKEKKYENEIGNVKRQTDKKKKRGTQVRKRLRECFRGC